MAPVNGEVDQKLKEINNGCLELLQILIQCLQVLHPKVAQLYISLFLLRKVNGPQQASVKVFNSALEELNDILRNGYIVLMQNAKNRASVAESRFQVLVSRVRLSKHDMAHLCTHITTQHHTYIHTVIWEIFVVNILLWLAQTTKIYHTKYF